MSYLSLRFWCVMCRSQLKADIVNEGETALNTSSLVTAEAWVQNSREKFVYTFCKKPTRGEIIFRAQTIKAFFLTHRFTISTLYSFV